VLIAVAARVSPLCVVVQVELSEGAAGGCERSDGREGSELARSGSHQRRECHQRQRENEQQAGRRTHRARQTALEIGRVTHSLRVCLGRALCWSLRIVSLQVIKEADIAKIVGELTEEQRSVNETRGNACTS